MERRGEGLSVSLFPGGEDGQNIHDALKPWGSVKGFGRVLMEILDKKAVLLLWPCQERMTREENK